MAGEVKGLEEVVAVLRGHMPILRRRYRVRSLGVFGSYVRGEQGRRSDLDLLVEFDDPPGLLEFIGFENELSDLLGVKVDLVPKRSLREELREIILQEAIVP